MSVRHDAFAGALAIVLLSFVAGYPFLLYLAPIIGDQLAIMLLVHLGALAGLCTAYAVSKTAKVTHGFFLFRPGILPVVYAFFLTNIATIQTYQEETGSLAETDPEVAYLVIFLAILVGWYGLVRKKFGLLSDWLFRRSRNIAQR